MSILFVVLKAIVKVSLRVFYSKTTFENRERGYFENPCIIVSNHPSTVMDPLNSVAWIGPQVNFLANASLFKTRLSNWFFNTFYCIKVERYQDTGGKPLNNIDAFMKAREHLEEGGCLYLAPEGGSYSRRELRKLKTGCARIAFDAEGSNDFNLGLTILPVGLNYGDPRHFRTELFTKFGTPIYMGDFQQDFQQNPKDAVRILTDVLSERLSELIICTKDTEEEFLQRKLEIIIRNEEFLVPNEDLARSQHLVKKMRYLEDQDKLAFEKFSAKVNGYFTKLKALNIEDKVLVSKRISLFDIIVFVLGLPFFLIGSVVNFFPIFLPYKINQKFNKDASYESTFKYVSGLVLFPLFYWVEIQLIEWIFKIDWISLIYIFIFILTGLFAEWYLGIGKLFIEKIRWKKTTSKQELLIDRKEILKQLDFEMTLQK